MTEMSSDHNLTHKKLDMTREDVRKLLPLSHLLDPEQSDVTTEFAERLIGLLVDVEAGLEQQATAFGGLSKMIRQLTSRLDKMQSEIAFLMGDPDPEGRG